MQPIAQRFTACFVVLAGTALFSFEASAAKSFQTPSCSQYPAERRAAARQAALENGGRPKPLMSVPCSNFCGALTWVPKAPVLELGPGFSGVEGAAAGIVDDTIFVSHGYTGTVDTPVLRIYDIPTDTWSRGANAAVARSEGIGAVVNGILYSIGGRGLPDVDAYDPVAMTWSRPTPMPTGRKGTALGVIAGKIHVIGGSTGSGPNLGTPMTTHEVYDPGPDTWSTAAPLPVPLLDIYASWAVADDLYVFGGFDGLGVVDTVHIYNATTDTWSLGMPMPTPRSNAAAAVLCSRIFVIGGTDATAASSLNTVEVYDPATDSWCTGPTKPTPISETSTGFISTGTAIHIMGSGPSGLSSDTHEALESTPTSCITSSLAPVQRLRGVQNGADTSWVWDTDPNASQYHLNSVSDKTLIRDPDAKLPLATSRCKTTTLTCNDTGAIAGPDIYYQLLSACGDLGPDEGPL